MTPAEYCQDKAARSGSSFYYSFLFLPPERRRAITALYAFCREVDDIADEGPDPQVAQAKLDWWRGEVAALFQGAPSHPVTQALAPGVAAYGLRKELLLEIIAGMEMDLHPRRYPDFAALTLYCHRVAGVVGELAAAIFGRTCPGTTDYAHRLGLAFQLTNIIRDVGEDARRGRIYLPQDELARFGVSEADLLAGREGPGFQALMAFQIERAEAAYDAALAALPAEDRKAQRPGLLMAAIYRAVLAKIRREGCPVLRRRVSLPPVQKLWLAWKTWVTT